MGRLLVSLPPPVLFNFLSKLLLFGSVYPVGVAVLTLKQSSETDGDLQNMEEKSCHPLPEDVGSSGKIARSLRDIPPAHYTLRIESFSQLSEMLSNTKVHNYISEVFEASGYKWKLSLYPKGDKERNGEGHISLYLVIAETKDLPLGWEVNVNFKLFLFNQIQDKYMAIQDADGKVKRFHEMKTEWGFAQLVPLSVFNDANNGYLICDTCVFGAESFVINYSGKGECISNVVGLESTHIWKISNFSALGDVCHRSDVFTIGNHNWELRLYPKGDLRGKKESSLSLFLNWCNPSEQKQKLFVKYRFCIRDHCHGQHKESEGEVPFLYFLPICDSRFLFEFSMAQLQVWCED